MVVCVNVCVLCMKVRCDLMIEMMGIFLMGDMFVLGSVCVCLFIFDKLLSFWGGYDLGVGWIVDCGYL